MLAEVGFFLTGLALVVVLYAAGAIGWSAQGDRARWFASGRNGVYAAAALLGLALLALLAAFLQDQFSIRYVAEHSSRELPLYLKISALWAGQEGSLLVWSFLQALFSAFVLCWPSEKSRLLVPWAVVVLNVITAFFTAVTLLLSNPFAPQSPVPADGLGLNPLLRHPGMVFHPPALYVGYVGLAVPFAFALAALITDRVGDWPAAARRWTLLSWLFLGIGLLLGARWAYDVLGWGGYWGWDPVENAGLMPWLAATALLHGLVMQDQRGGFRWWNLILALFSFLLVLFGTFATRSGMIQSVHAFARSPLGYYFLAFMAMTLVGAVALMLLYRRHTLRDARPMEGLFSRDGMFFLTVILFLTLTATVFIGSVLPTLTEVLAGQRFEAGPEWFDRTTGPQFAALVLLLGLCPIVGRAAGALKQLGRRGWPALVGAAAVALAAYLSGFTDWMSLLGFALAGLAGGTAVAEYVHDVSQRSRKQGEDPLRALWHLVGRQRRKYGGYLVHIGVVLMALGIIGTRLYEFESELVLTAGEPVAVGDYTFVLENLHRQDAGDHMTYLADLTVYRDSAYLATMQPRVDQYAATHDQSVGVPAVRPGVREDLYLVLAGWSADGATATVKVHVNALASFLWLGGLVLLAGGAVALWPAAATSLAVPQARRQRASALIGLALGIAVLGAAVYAMWGAGHGVESQAAGRPLVGQLAPDFDLALLDGSSLALSQQRGRVVVLNFWATWCPPCQDELPALEAVWTEYRDRDVVLVGAAYQNEPLDVQGAIVDFGLTYPIGLDQSDRAAVAYGITGVPETFVINREGRVAYVHIGPVTAEQLRAELDDLLDR